MALLREGFLSTPPAVIQACPYQLLIIPKPSGRLLASAWTLVFGCCPEKITNQSNKHYPKQIQAGCAPAFRILGNIEFMKGLNFHVAPETPTVWSY